MHRKNDLRADFGRDGKGAGMMRHIARFTIFERNFLKRVVRIDPLLCRVDRVFVDVRCIDAKVPFDLVIIPEFLQRHRKRIGLFPGGAAHRPDPQGRSCVAFLKQTFENPRLHSLPDVQVAKEICHTDQKLPVQKLHFAGVFAEVIQIIADFREAQKPHPPRNTSLESRFLIKGKIDLCLFADRL